MAAFQFHYLLNIQLTANRILFAKFLHGLPCKTLYMLLHLLPSFKFNITQNSSHVR